MDAVVELTGTVATHILVLSRHLYIPVLRIYSVFLNMSPKGACYGAQKFFAEKKKLVMTQVLINNSPAP